MRSAAIYYKNYLSGFLTETDDGAYIFQYEEKYIKEHPDQFLTFTMPVGSNPFTHDRLFPFFEGLIPEGWLLEVASQKWKINQNDRMGLLLACCQNCIGAVGVQPIPLDNE